MQVPSPRQPRRTAETVIVFAHRGERGHYPENTMLAFAQAARYDIQALEIDIHCTRDGVPVVIHDETVDRTTNGRGLVRDMTLDVLQALDAGYCWPADQPPENQAAAATAGAFPFRGQGLTVPTVAEVFEAYPHLWINIDIKHHLPDIIEPFVRLIRAHGMADRVCVGSFDDETMARFRAACPEVTTAATRSEVRRLFVLQRLGLGRFYRGHGRAFQIPEYSDRHQLVTAGFIAAAHRQGAAVHVWTVNDTADMQRLIDLGVDGIITDYPARLLGLLGRLPDAAGREGAMS